MVAHLSTNRARRRLTLLIKAIALTTMPDHQPDDGDGDGDGDGDTAAVVIIV